MKKYIKRVCKIIIFISLIAVLTYIASKTLIVKREDGITSMQGIYAQEPNTIDVLITGSSRAGINISVEELWTDYGISSYTLWGSIQPFWNTYYFLKEALKSQNPKVVILDVFAATRMFEYSDDARQITNIEGMHFNLNKISAIKVSAPKERWHDLALGFPVYHTRFAELEEKDYKHYPWSFGAINNKGNRVGGLYGSGNTVQVEYDYNCISCPLLPKEEEYLRKIIGLCRDQQLPLVLISTPSESRQDYQPYFNEVNNIAKEYNIPYINYDKLDKQTTITQSDFWMDNAHLNTNGARKISSNLGQYLISNYNLIDHRGDKRYFSWHEHSIEMQNLYISKITEINDYINELIRDNRTLFLFQSESSDNTNKYNTLIQQLSRLGILEIKREMSGVWIKDDKLDSPNEFTNVSNTFIYDKKEFTFDTVDGEIIVDGNVICTLDNSEIILVVYDTNNHSIIDICRFGKENNYQLQKQED